MIIFADTRIVFVVCLLCSIVCLICNMNLCFMSLLFISLFVLLITCLFICEVNLDGEQMMWFLFFNFVILNVIGILQFRLNRVQKILKIGTFLTLSIAAVGFRRWLFCCPHIAVHFRSFFDKLKGTYSRCRVFGYHNLLQNRFWDILTAWTISSASKITIRDVP